MGCSFVCDGIFGCVWDECVCLGWGIGGGKFGVVVVDCLMDFNVYSICSRFVVEINVGYLVWFNG